MLNRSTEILPHLDNIEVQVEPDGYEIAEGDDNSMKFELSRLDLFAPLKPLPQGLRQIGEYCDGKERKLPVVSFKYHKKTGVDGEWEEYERGIIVRGIGRGVHSGHIGQPPTWYLIGPQIGHFNMEEMSFKLDTDPRKPPEGAEPKIITSKHFSVSCIDGGPFGEPIDASPARAKICL